MTVTVGIRELKAELSHYVREATGGEVVIITDHGTPVAELRPLGSDSAAERLVAAGLAIPAGEPKSDDFPPPVPVTGSVGDLVAEQRG